LVTSFQSVRSKSVDDCERNGDIFNSYAAKPWSPVVIGNQDLANRYGGLTSLPMTLLIDRNGKIAESHAGMVDKDAFESKIKALLHERPAT
jgi:hypothetical protein